MCIVCKYERENPPYISDNQLIHRNYTLSKNRNINLKLCYVHDVEFFVYGERYFLERYPKFGEWLDKNAKSKSKDFLDMDEFFNQE